MSFRARSYPKTKEAHEAQDARRLAEAKKSPAFGEYKANEAHIQHVIHACHEDTVRDSEGDHKPAEPEERNVRVPAYDTVTRVGGHARLEPEECQELTTQKRLHAN